MTNLILHTYHSDVLDFYYNVFYKIYFIHKLLVTTFMQLESSYFNYGYIVPHNI